MAALRSGARAFGLAALWAATPAAPAGAQQLATSPPTTTPPSPPTATSLMQAPPPTGFLCLGEAESVARGVSIAELEEERDRRLAALAAGAVAAPERAHAACVIAELMKRLGDPRAPAFYEQAIAANPADPAYELWYGRYLSWRGAALPLAAEAESHLLAALDKQDRFHGENQVGSTDQVLRDWARWNLALLYQQDGLPLLPVGAKAFPYADHHAAVELAPQVSLMATGVVGYDTVDFWDPADTRRFTSEAQIAAQRVGVATLPQATLRAIARASFRYDSQGRLRLRQAWLGTLDVGVRQAKFFDSQIVSFNDPTVFGDVSLRELGAEWIRPFNLYPLFDLTLDAQYTRQRLIGAVETLPAEAQDLNIYAATLAAARRLGPDELTVAASYALLDIPDLTTGALDQRGRARIIRSAAIDYAFYRPLALPQVHDETWTLKRTQTRGWHLFAIGVLDEEQFGTTVVGRRNVVVGTSFKGWQDWDFLVSETVFDGQTTTLGFDVPALDNRQLRTALRAMVRLIDEDTHPAPPTSPLSAMSLAFPVRYDAAIAGPNSFENLRGGAELWAKLWSAALRGTSFYVDAGVEAQWFYRLDKVLPAAYVDLHLGWPPGNYVPAYF